MTNLDGKTLIKKLYKTMRSSDEILPFSFVYTIKLILYKSKMLNEPLAYLTLALTNDYLVGHYHYLFTRICDEINFLEDLYNDLEAYQRLFNCGKIGINEYNGNFYYYAEKIEKYDALYLSHFNEYKFLMDKKNKIDVSLREALKYYQLYLQNPEPCKEFPLEVIYRYISTIYSGNADYENAAKYLEMIRDNQSIEEQINYCAAGLPIGKLYLKAGTKQAIEYWERTKMHPRYKTSIQFKAIVDRELSAVKAKDEKHYKYKSRIVKKIITDIYDWLNFIIYLKQETV